MVVYDIYFTTVRYKTGAIRPKSADNKVGLFMHWALRAHCIVGLSWQLILLDVLAIGTGDLMALGSHLLKRRGIYGAFRIRIYMNIELRRVDWHIILLF